MPGKEPKSSLYELGYDPAVFLVLLEMSLMISGAAILQRTSPAFFFFFSPSEIAFSHRTSPICLILWDTGGQERSSLSLVALPISYSLAWKVDSGLLHPGNVPEKVVPAE